jgi:hypothetical protein
MRQTWVNIVTAAFVAGLLMLAADACGNGKSRQHNHLSGSHRARSVVSDLPAQVLSLHYLNDGDGDPAGDGDEDADSKRDNDNDPSADRGNANNNQLYIDRDDRGELVFGPAADPADKTKITELVRRYYAAAADGDGISACTMLVPGQARRVPADAGLLAFFLRGSKSCSIALTRLFRHFHTSLIAPVVVTAVQLNGNRALALLGSTTMHASYITMRRSHGVWRIELPLAGSPLANTPS